MDGLGVNHICLKNDNTQILGDVTRLGLQVILRKMLHAGFSEKCMYVNCAINEKLLTTQIHLSQQLCFFMIC